jgi:hypothetical protein
MTFMGAPAALAAIGDKFIPTRKRAPAARVDTAIHLRIDGKAHPSSPTPRNNLRGFYRSAQSTVQPATREKEAFPAFTQ